VDLKLLAQQERIGPKQKAPVKKKVKLPQQPAVKRHHIRYGLWIAFASMLLAGATIVFYFKFVTINITVSPKELFFGPVEVGEINTKDITLTNEGFRPITIDSVLLRSQSRSFSISTDQLNKAIGTRGSLIIRVNFKPESKGQYNDSLEITTSTGTRLEEIVLSGTGVIKAIEKQPQKSLIIKFPKEIRLEVPIAGIELKPKKIPNWKIFSGIAIFILAATCCYGIYLWRSRKIPEDQAPLWDKNGKRHFSLGSISPETSPRLDDEALNQIADSMGYFVSEQTGKLLNVPVSLEKTLQKGGIPSLEFYKRKQSRALIILEDTFAEATIWNPIARELAQGLMLRGVPVIYGRFTGCPEQFQTEDGSLHQLEDFENQRRGYLVLIFTDSKGLYRHESTFVIETLSRWPMLSWMELREARQWDRMTAVPARYGLPVYPATSSGILTAIKGFLTERGITTDVSGQYRKWHGLPGYADVKLDAYLEKILGDAILWALDCSMIQPINQGLADKLRIKFHPHLPVERIERLYLLPGTTYNVSGLRFSDDVMKFLRKGFLIRRDEKAQEDVINFILHEVELAEPTEEGSMAHLSWEAVKERVRLELDIDNNLQRLAELAKTPLGASIKAALENYGFSPESNKIPLRIKPPGKDALQRFVRITGSPEVALLKAYPIARGHWLTLSMLFILILGFSGGAVNAYLKTLPSGPPKIGINAPLTGDIPKVGECTKFAAQMWLEDVNAAGGIQVGDKKYKVHLVIADNESRAESAVKANMKLITRDAVLAIVGPQSSKQAVPAGGKANELETPMISPWSTNPDTTKDRPFVFRTSFLDPFQGPVIASFATAEFGASKAAVLYDVASYYPKGLAEHFKRAWEQIHGPGSVVAFESFTTKETDFSAQLSTIIKSGAEFFFAPQYYNEVALIVQQARKLGWDKPIVGGDAWGTTETIKLCGKDCYGLFFSTHFTAVGVTGAARKFVDRYTRKHGYVPDDVAALTWDTMHIVQQAIQNCGELTEDIAIDRRCVRDAMAKTNFPGITGNITFNENGDPHKCAVIVRISDAGEFELYKLVCPS
jgi:branched-chain amino acid transport system substrate-binding protein